MLGQLLNWSSMLPILGRITFLFDSTPRIVGHGKRMYTRVTSRPHSNVFETATEVW